MLKIPPKQYNVILIVADSLSANHMSLYGYHRKTTPFLDEYFGSQGIVYTNARSTSSWTLPAFASFMRSRLPSRISVGDLLRTERTLLDVVRKNDIQVVAYLKEFHLPNAILQSVGILFDTKEYQTFRYHDHESGFKEAAGWLRARAEDESATKPFFFFVHDATCHNPYEETPERYKTMFDATLDVRGPATVSNYLDSLTMLGVDNINESKRLELLYDQGVRYLDDLLKDFLEKIPRSILETSVIVFVADHGDEFGEHHSNFKHSHSLHESIIRIPFAIRIPDTVPQHISSPVTLLDLAPTILSFFSIKVPDYFDGAPVLQKKKRWPLLRISRAEGNAASYMTKYTNLFTAKDQDVRKITSTKHISWVVGKWKLLKCGDRLEVYNIQRDPYEKNNLCKNIFIANLAFVLYTLNKAFWGEYSVFVRKRYQKRYRIWRRSVNKLLFKTQE